MFEKEIDKQEAEYIIKEMVRAGAVCEGENGYWFDFKFPDLHLHIVNQRVRLLVTTHRPLLAEEKKAYDKAAGDHAFDPSSDFVKEYWFNERMLNGEIEVSLTHCLSWLAQIRRAKTKQPSLPPSPKPSAEAVIEDRSSGPSWFARLKAWCKKPRDRSHIGYNDPRFALPCHKLTVVPPLPPEGAQSGICYVLSPEQAEEKKRNDIVEFTNLAANLSATTHVSPGEALEMIRKAGNFGSQDDLDRLQLENIELRQIIEACSCGRSNRAAMLADVKQLKGDSDMILALMELGKPYMELTTKLKEHPEDYDRPCLCELCRSDG